MAGLIGYHQRRRLAMQACRLLIGAVAIDDDGDTPLKKRMLGEALELAIVATGLTLEDCKRAAALADELANEIQGKGKV